MLEYISLLGEPIANRYQTVIRNIKGASNSFYDSYLDLLEETLKQIADDFNVPYEEGTTCGKLIRKDEMKVVMMGMLRLDEATYGKLSDYTQKVNKHKHHREKNVSVDIVTNYMKVYWKTSKPYADYMGIKAENEYDETFFAGIFDLTEKENKRLKEEAEGLKDEVKALLEKNQFTADQARNFQEVIQRGQVQYHELEEENSALFQEINALKDIKINSLEAKLNKAFDMLLSLEEAVKENRALSMAVGDTICGEDKFKEYIAKAKKAVSDTPHYVEEGAEALSDAKSVVDAVNTISNKIIDKLTK